MSPDYKEMDRIRGEMRKKGYDVRTVKTGKDGKGRKDILLKMTGMKWEDGKWVDEKKIR